MAQTNYRQLARSAAQRHGLDPNVFERQIQQESGFNPNAVSPAGAIGIAQFMPGTARGVGINPRNPQQALDGAARLMASYVQKFGSYKNALVAYNAGPGAVGGRLPAETQNYVKVILGGRSPQVSRRGTGSASAPGSPSGGTPAAPGMDIRRQIALSMLGFGGAGSDPLSLALQQAQQPQAQPSSPTQQQPQVAPTHGHGHGTAMFDGKPVEGWIAPILAEARKTGLWKGAVTSGQRTKAQQLSAAKNFGLQHYGPKGPLGSNHIAGRGAVDVSDPQGLKRALQTLHVNRLKSAMADDPVHFSATGY